MRLLKNIQRLTLSTIFILALSACSSKDNSDANAIAQTGGTSNTHTNQTTQNDNNNTHTDNNATSDNDSNTETNATTDVTPPVITLNGQTNITLQQNTAYTELGATAVDAVDGNLTVAISGTVNTSTVGEYTLTYTATDSAGNEANLTRNVEVVNTVPTLTSITLEGNTTTVNVGDTVQLTLKGTYSDGSSGTVDANITYILTPTENAEVNGSVLRAKKDGNVTIQAKVGNTLSNTIALNITWVVDGHVLPPEPDKTLNDSTLLGIDTNNNGVRDDVERWIYETYDEYVPCHQEPDGEETLPSGQVVQFAKEVCEDTPVPYHPVVRAVVMQGARAAQIIIQEPEKARETREIFSFAYFCSFVLNDFRDNNQRKLYENYIFGDEFKKVQFNTTERARAFGKYNFNLSGGVYDLPTDAVMLQGCSQEVHILLEDLK